MLEEKHEPELQEKFRNDADNAGLKQAEDELIEKVESLKSQITENSKDHEKSISAYKEKFITSESSYLKQKEINQSIQENIGQLQKQIDDMRAQYDEDVSTKLQALLQQNSREIEEHRRVLETKQREIHDLKEKFIQLKEKAQIRIHDLKQQSEYKDEELANERNHHNKRMQEMEESDTELQNKVAVKLESEFMRFSFLFMFDK